MKQSLALLGLYVVTVVTLQVAGFLISRLIGYFNPAMSLMAFLVMFMGMFALAWPIAVRISDRFIPETERERQERLARV